MAAIAQIVDGIDGLVLADLNALAAGSGAGTMLGRGTLELADVAGPELQNRQVIWSPLSEPEQLSTRRITVPLVVLSETPSDLAQRVQRINALTSVPFWLKVRRHATATAMYLRCFPTIPKWQTNIAAVGGTTHAIGTIETDTDPYGYGSRVDIAPADIPQDPALPGAWVLDVNNVQGDSLTPICVSSNDTALLQSDHGLLIAVRRRGVPANLGPLVAQGESASQMLPLGTNAPTMGTFSADSSFSNGAGAFVTFAPAGGDDSFGQLEWSGMFSGLEAPGTYRLLVRARRVGASAGLEHNIRAAVGPLVMDALFTAAGGDTRVVDMGLVQVPIGQPSYFASPQPSVGASCPDITLLVWKTSTGAGRLDIDWIALVPADEGQGISYGSAGGLAVGQWWHLDGYDHTPRVFSDHPFSAGALAAGQLPNAGLRFIGGVPMLGPGSNRLYFVGGLQTGSQGTWPPSKVITLQVSYWPRFGWLS